MQDLAIQMRGLRRWMGWLTAVLALLTLLSCFFAAAGAVFIAGVISTSMDGDTIPEGQVAITREQYERALGRDLASLEVRVVTVKYPDETFMEPAEEALYVEYRLKSAGVLFANVVEPDETALIPTRGSIPSAMTAEQFRGLVKAYAAESTVPFGGAYHFSDAPFGDEVEEVVAIAGKDYATKTLWVVAPGVKLEGDEFETNSISRSGSRALVFQEDPKTATFTFIGSDDPEDWTMW